MDSRGRGRGGRGGRGGNRGGGGGERAREAGSGGDVRVGNTVAGRGGRGGARGGRGAAAGNQQRVDSQSKGAEEVHSGQRATPIAESGNIDGKIWAKEVDRQLCFLPFFPSDNAGFGGDPLQTAEVLKMADEGLEAILSFTLSKFWSQITHDSNLQIFLDTFLRYRRRAFDPRELLRGDSSSGDEAALRLEEKVLQVLLRMSSPTGFGAAAEKGDRLSAAAHASLIYDRWLFDIPKLLDMCALYSAVDMQLAQRVVGSVFAAQPSYYTDLNHALPLIQNALDQASVSLADLEAIAAAGGALDGDAAVDAALYLSDCSFTLAALLRVHEDAASHVLQSGIHVTAAAAYKRFCAASKRGSALAEAGVLGLGLVRHVRGALLDLGHRILQSSLITPMLSGRRKGGGARLLRAAVEAMAGAGAGAGAEGGGRAVRDLEFRHKLSQELQRAAASVSGADRSDLEACIEACKRPPASAAVSGAGQAEEVDMAAVKQIQEMLPDYGDGFIWEMLKAMDRSVERAIQALLEGNIPPHIDAMDRSAPLKQNPAGPAAAAGAKGGGRGGGGLKAAEKAGGAKYSLSDRLNVFDGDEFDVIKGGKVDLSRLHTKSAVARKTDVLSESIVEGEEREEMKRRTRMLMQLQEVDEREAELAEAMAAEAAGVEGAEGWVATARGKVEEARDEVQASRLAAGAAAGEYDDEYDDGLDGMGMMSLDDGAGGGELESKAFLLRGIGRGGGERRGITGVALVPENSDEGGEDEEGAGPGGSGVNNPNWSRSETEEDKDGSVEGGSVGAGRGRGRGRGGGGPGRATAEEKASRGRGWGKAHAQEARRKEERKAAVANHHRKDRATRKMRMAGLPG